MFGIKDLKADVEMLRNQIGEVESLLQEIKTELSEHKSNEITFEEIGNVIESSLKDFGSELERLFKEHETFKIEEKKASENSQKKDKKGK